MKMLKVVVSDFQGLEGMHEYDLKDSKIFTQVGKNGIGKTSFLNAVRYCLTGQTPEGEIISFGKTNALVSIVMESETSFTRQLTEKGQKCYVNGKQVSVTEFNNQVSRYVSVSAMKVLTSAEALGAMTPTTLEELLLEYGGAFTKEEILSFVNNMTDRKKEEIEKLIPTDRKMEIRDLSVIYTDFFERRRVLKKSLTEKDAHIKLLKKEGLAAPMKDKEALEQTLNDALEKQKVVSAYQTTARAYEQAVKQAAAQEARAKSLKEEIAKLHLPEGYAPDKREIAEKELAISIERKNEAVQNFSTFSATVTSLVKALTTLEQPVCPLSAKLKCTTDKTAVRTELEEAKKNAETSAEMARVQAAKADKRAKYCQDFLKKLDLGKAIEEKIALYQKQIQEIEANPIQIPEKPAEYDAKAVDAMVKAAKAELDAYNRYMQYVEIRKEFLKEKEEYIVLDELVASFSSKGEVKERLMNKFIKDFEADCNKIAEKLGDGKMRIRLVQRNGVVVCADVRHNGKFLEFKSLSGGEKAKVIYILMSLLAEKSGFRIMMLDELSVLDNEGLDTLLGTIVDHKDEFDHVFICMVDHEDSVNLLKKHNLI